MADLAALRDHVYREMLDVRADREPLNANSLYALVDRFFGGNPPVSRTTFYSWLGGPRRSLFPAHYFWSVCPL